MDIKQRIGLRIKEVRIQKNMSQEEVANTAEMDRSFMTHIESGKRNVSIETLQRTLSALSISFKDFFDAKEFQKL